MICGTGVDIVDIERIRAILERHENRFLKRVFTPEEVEYSRKKHDHVYSLSARFAAKEATLKAFGTGMFNGIGLKEISVNRTTGRPKIKLTGKARDMAHKMGVESIHLSISHDKGMAVAFVILQMA